MLSIQKILISFFFVSAFLSLAHPFVIAKDALQVPLNMGAASVAQVGRDLIVKTAQKTQMIKRHNLDAALRGISTNRLKKIISRGAYLSLRQNNKGEFLMSMNGRLKGGGVFGATVGAFLGKAAVSIVGHGSILLVSSAVGMVCPPAGIAVGIGLESCFGAPIETASFAGAVAGGVALGTLTGPV